MVNLKAILRLGGLRSKEQPQPQMSHRGGGLLEKPTAAGEPRPGEPQHSPPAKWQPPTQGTTPADRKRINKRNRRRLADNPRP